MINDEFTPDAVLGVLRGCNCSECLTGDDRWCCRTWPTGHANDCTCHDLAVGVSSCRRCYIAAMGGGR